MYSDDSIRSYLDSLASREPIPGGGSAAALVGAIGAALLSKVASFTIGKEKYKRVEAEMKDILKKTESSRKAFIKLCSEDAAAYKKLPEAFKLPKGEKRAKKIQASLKEAMDVPLQVCKRACEAAKLCMPLARKSNANLITDVGDGALMLECAFQAALLNVDINLKGIKDEKFILETKKAIETMKKEINIINKEVKKIVKGETK